MMMFQTGELQKYNLTDHNQYIGLIAYNPRVNFKTYFTRPFIRNGARELISVGKINYAVIDEFITKSLTAYYASIESQKSQDIKNQMIAEYQQLYYLWQTIYTAKQTNDIALSSYYDDIIYRLYILGFKNIETQTQG